MKRKAGISEEEWRSQMGERKRIAEGRMNRHDAGFVELDEIRVAARKWYGSESLDDCCLAENRLNRGEKP